MFLAEKVQLGLFDVKMEASRLARSMEEMKGFCQGSGVGQAKDDVTHKSVQQDVWMGGENGR